VVGAVQRVDHSLAWILWPELALGLPARSSFLHHDRGSVQPQRRGSWVGWPSQGGL